TLVNIFRIDRVSAGLRSHRFLSLRYPISIGRLYLKLWTVSVGLQGLKIASGSSSVGPKVGVVKILDLLGCFAILPVCSTQQPINTRFCSTAAYLPFMANKEIIHVDRMLQTHSLHWMMNQSYGSAPCL